MQWIVKNQNFSWSLCTSGRFSEALSERLKHSISVNMSPRRSRIGKTCCSTIQSVRVHTYYGPDILASLHALTSFLSSPTSSSTLPPLLSTLLIWARNSDTCSYDMTGGFNPFCGSHFVLLAAPFSMVNFRENSLNVFIVLYAVFIIIGSVILLCPLCWLVWSVCRSVFLNFL